MKKRFLSTCRLLLLYFRLNLASALEYRVSFVLSILTVAISNGAFIFFWWVLFDNVSGLIGGYSFQDILFIWSLTSMSFGLAMVMCAGASRLGQLINSGELDTFLLQPKNLLINTVCARTDISAWGDILYGLVLMALSGQDALGWLYFSIGSITGMLLMVSTMVLFQSLCFYWGDVKVAGSLALEFVINFNIYPEGIYTGVVRILMYTLIPSGFMVHLPLRLSHGFPAWGLLILFAATAAYMLVTRTLFYRGLKHYTSGNLIVTRL